MSTLKHLRSSVGRKAVLALSGMALMAFLIVHLGGNLTLLAGGGNLFNSYAHHLEALGPLLYLMEFGLIAIFLFHICLALGVQLEKWRAREDRYAVVATKGGPSKQTLASRSMIVTGVMLLVFVPLHVWMFKYNFGHGHPLTHLEGMKEPVKDLYITVVQAFASPVVAWGYAGVMFFLGFHLRHGFWSSLQSLGAMKPKLSPLIYTAGLGFAVLMAGGFLLLPVWIHFNAPSLLAAATAVTGGAP